MIVRSDGATPRIDPSAQVAASAVISGDVHIGPRCRIGHGAVLVGPRAYLVGCTVEDDVFLATGATVFNGARIGAGSQVRINGLVHLRSVLPPRSMVPIGWVAVGDPVQILPAGEHEAIWAVQQTLDFPGYVFGQPRPAPGESMMPALMPRYAAALRRRHAEDEVV